MPAAGLTEVAQRLREVRQAHQRFLALYAAEVALGGPGIDRVAAAVIQDTGPESERGDRSAWQPPDSGGTGHGGGDWQ